MSHLSQEGHSNTSDTFGGIMSSAKSCIIPNPCENNAGSGEAGNSTAQRSDLSL